MWRCKGKGLEGCPQLGTCEQKIRNGFIWNVDNKQLLRNYCHNLFLLLLLLFLIKKEKHPWWLSDKNLPASAGDTDSIPDPERSHMLQSS